MVNAALRRDANTYEKEEEAAHNFARFDEVQSLIIETVHATCFIRGSFGEKAI